MPTNPSQTPRGTPLTQAQIREILGKCYPGMPETALSDEEADLRSQMVFDDMESVGFALVFDASWPVPAPGDETIWIPSYRLPGAIYGPQADPDGTESRDAAGPLLSCGEFVRLSKACKLGRLYLTPEKWPSRFTTRLRDPKNHLAVLEEVLWLGRWHAPENVEMTYKQNPATGKDIDWRFTCCGQTINLEVKFRQRDWVGLVDGEHFSRDFDSYFRDVEGKFGPRANSELNIVGLTTISPPDRGLRECTRRFLDRHPEIDAIIFWSLHDPEGTRPEIHGRQADLIRTLLRSADREDEMLVAPIRHLWRKSDERRALSPGETLDAISRIAHDSGIPGNTAREL